MYIYSRLGCVRELSIQTVVTRHSSLVTRHSYRLDHEPYPEPPLDIVFFRLFVVRQFSSSPQSAAICSVPRPTEFTYDCRTYGCMLGMVHPLTLIRSVRQYWVLHFWTATLKAMYSLSWRRVVWQILANVSQIHTASSLSLKCNSIIILIFFIPCNIICT